VPSSQKDNPIALREETKSPRTVKPFTPPSGSRALYFSKHATLSAFHVSSFSSTSHSSLHYENDAAAFPQGQVFIVLMKQWNPVLMQGTASMVHLLLHLHLPWIDVRYELRRRRNLASSRPSFTAIWIYGLRFWSSGGTYPCRSNEVLVIRVTLMIRGKLLRRRSPGPRALRWVVTPAAHIHNTLGSYVPSAQNCGRDFAV